MALKSYRDQIAPGVLNKNKPLNIYFYFQFFLSGDLKI
jgi:hypothetical protein